MNTNVAKGYGPRESVHAFLEALSNMLTDYGFGGGSRTKHIMAAPARGVKATEHRGPGRPKSTTVLSVVGKRKRGRPRKSAEVLSTLEKIPAGEPRGKSARTLAQEKTKRGRPAKIQTTETAPKKRGRPPKAQAPVIVAKRRGRPPKNLAVIIDQAESASFKQHLVEAVESVAKPKRGRPRKVTIIEEAVIKRGPGRPPKAMAATAK